MKGLFLILRGRKWKLRVVNVVGFPFPWKILGRCWEGKSDGILGLGGDENKGPEICILRTRRPHKERKGFREALDEWLVQSSDHLLRLCRWISNTSPRFMEISCAFSHYTLFIFIKKQLCSLSFYLYFCEGMCW